MQFKLATFLTTALAAANTVNAIVADEVVMNIEKVTEISADTDDILKSVKSPFNIPTLIPRAINSFKDIITTVTSSVDMLSDAEGESIDSEDAQQEICDAFTGFVKVHIALLDTVIGKEGLLSSTPFTAPIAAVLRAIEGGVDNLAFGLIGLVPSCEDEAMKEKEKLDEKLSESIDTYS